jgi:hypothetical protein
VVGADDDGSIGDVGELLELGVLAGMVGEIVDH